VGAVIKDPKKNPVEKEMGAANGALAEEGEDG